MDVGIFGGSFDPVHIGHVRVAEACQRGVPLDVVLFVPAAAQPLKPHGPVASAEDRAAMLELAIDSAPGLGVSTIEIDRGGISYTAETLRQLSTERPKDSLHLILGADALADLPNWREPDEIRRLARLVVVDRPGTPAVSRPARDGVAREAIAISMEPLNVSSSDIRSRIARGELIAGLVPPAVAAYIDRKKLYRGG